jgi:hypothetical protein
MWVALLHASPTPCDSQENNMTLDTILMTVFVLFLIALFGDR